MLSDLQRWFQLDAAAVPAPDGKGPALIGTPTMPTMQTCMTTELRISLKYKKAVPDVCSKHLSRTRRSSDLALNLGAPSHDWKATAKPALHGGRLTKTKRLCGLIFHPGTEGKPLSARRSN